MQVTIVDTRPKWQVKEDRIMACMHFCRDFRRCKSRIGHECKVLGGSEIPKIGGRSS